MTTPCFTEMLTFKKWKLKVILVTLRQVASFVADVPGFFSPGFQCWSDLRSGPATHMQKGGHMIVLQNKNIPLSLTFTKGKKDLFFKKR